MGNFGMIDDSPNRDNYGATPWTRTNTNNTSTTRTPTSTSTLTPTSSKPMLLHDPAPAASILASSRASATNSNTNANTTITTPLRSTDPNRPATASDGLLAPLLPADTSSTTSNTTTDTTNPSTKTDDYLRERMRAMAGVVYAVQNDSDDEGGNGAAGVGAGGAWRKVRVRGMLLVAGLALANGVLLALLFTTGSTACPGVISPGLLAFVFGLRHGVDADHIAAIDNVTRKLLADGRTPLTVGLWFSLGHSTVVTVLCVVVASGSQWMRNHMHAATGAGLIIGTAVSATVLLIIGVINMILSTRLYTAWRESRLAVAAEQDAEARHTQAHRFNIPHTHVASVDSDANVEVKSGGGIVTCCCPSLVRAVDSEFKMYGVGFLFGLGFDTASEMALLALASIGGGQDSQGLSPLCILVLPLLFTSGMSLVDTLDGMMMLWTYKWASQDPTKKLFFNLYITTVSGLVALVVATVEVLGCVQTELSPSRPGWFWHGVASINDHFEMVGYSIVGLFVVSACIAISCVKFCPAPSPPKPAPASDTGSDPGRASDPLIRGDGDKQEQEVNEDDGEEVPPKKPDVDTSSDEYLRKRMLAAAFAPVDPDSIMDI